ncbi:MAG: nucleoid-structuring protein [Microvirga sp.]|jgi:HK97 family phage portal protein|nr:nucleoid-structuring protein [Microvirga sp.]
MSLWTRFFGAERKSSALGAETLELLRSLGYARESKSGTTVTWDSALDVSTVLACVRVIAEGIAQVPIEIRSARPDGGSELAADHPLFSVLARKPNAWQTSFGFRETLIFHVALAGNAFFFKNVVGGKLVELIPLLPGHVTVERLSSLAIRYRVRSEVDGTEQIFPQEAIWHIRGPSWNTWSGMDATKRAREAIGLAVATEESQALLHRNGAKPSMLYSINEKLDEAGYKSLIGWIESHVSGAAAHKPFVLDGGATATPLTMTGVDAQHLETRKFQIEEVCRHFKVFPMMVGHSDKTATFASAEAFFDAHIKHTIHPWCERIESAINVDLIGGDGTVFAEFDLDGLQRGAFKDRYEGYAKALGSGGSPAWMTQDEVRAKENLNPMGGDAAKLPKPVAQPAKPTLTPAEDEKE